METTSLYLHIPFCVRRCSYCDFTTYAGMTHRIADYVEALQKEMRWLAESSPEPVPVHTIYFGGGTPSLLPAEQVGMILDCARKSFQVQPGAEISLEANPGTLSQDWLAQVHSMGANRLSLGMQSAHPTDLAMLQRIHAYPDVLDAVGMARRAGFDNISLDLMYGIPGQPLKRWQANVHLAVGLQVEHLSMYAVMIEPGTPLQRWVERGLVPPVDDDLQADMLDWAEDYLQEAGFRQYEISNWARVDAAGRWRICAHNNQYWQDKPYLGVGAGAHGYTGGIRTENIAGIEEYILSMNTPKSGLAYPQTPATTQAAAIDQRQEMQEFMMMGLRLTEEGIRRDTFAARFGLSLGDAYRIPIQKLISQGLLEWAGEQKECLRLTKRGKRLGNRVFMEFVGEM